MHRLCRRRYRLFTMAVPVAMPMTVPVVVPVLMPVAMPVTVAVIVAMIMSTPLSMSQGPMTKRELSTISPTSHTIVTITMRISDGFLDPEPRHRIAGDPAQRAKLLQRSLETPLQLIGNDEQQLPRRVLDQRHGGQENQQRNQDCCERVPEIPGVQQRQHCRENHC